MYMTNALGRREKWTPWENNNNFHPQHLLRYHNCEVFILFSLVLCWRNQIFGILSYSYSCRTTRTDERTKCGEEIYGDASDNIDGKRE